MAQRASLTGGSLLSLDQQFQRDPQNLPQRHPQLTRSSLPVGAGRAGIGAVASSAAGASSSSSFSSSPSIVADTPPLLPPIKRLSFGHYRQPSSPLAAEPLSYSSSPAAHNSNRNNLRVSASGNASGDHLASSRRDSQVDLVSPVSDTFSSRPTPAPSEQEPAYRLPPIGKHSPRF